MATANLRASNRRLLGGLVIFSFIVLEAAIGGQAIGAMVRQTVQVQTTLMHSHAPG